MQTRKHALFFLAIGKKSKRKNLFQYDGTYFLKKKFLLYQLHYEVNIFIKQSLIRMTEYIIKIFLITTFLYFILSRKKKVFRKSHHLENLTLLLILTLFQLKNFLLRF